MENSNLIQEKTKLLLSFSKVINLLMLKILQDLLLKNTEKSICLKVIGALRRQDKNLEAWDAHKKAVELDPNDHESYCNLGVTFQLLGKLKEAEVNFTKAINLKPDHAKSYFNLANTLIAQK